MTNYTYHIYCNPAPDGNVESLRAELLRAEADRYAAETHLEVANLEKVWTHLLQVY